jgi:hypothetical protein
MSPIENELHLRVAIEQMAQLYGQGDRDAQEPHWDEAMRREMAFETNHLRVAFEREVALYLAKNTI